MRIEDLQEAQRLVSKLSDAVLAQQEIISDIRQGLIDYTNYLQTQLEMARDATIKEYEND